MLITKKVEGHSIVLDYKPIKKYPHYTIYEVYKDNKYLYNTCFTNSQLKRIIDAGYVTSDEEVVDSVCS